MKLLDKVVRNNPVIIILLIIYVLVPGISYSQQTDSDTTESKSVYHFRKWAVPGVLLATGLYILTDDAQINRFEIVEERNEYLPGFQNKLDNYLQFAPAAAALGMSVSGVKGKDGTGNMVLKLAKAELIMMAVVYPLKSLTKGARPDNGAPTTFPSGHTAQAFVAASFLDEQYRHKSVWISIAGYATATGVGVSRMLNNRHWISDVFAGAGIGIASYQLSSLTHRYKWKNKNATAFIMPWINPSPQGKLTGVTYVATF